MSPAKLAAAHQEPNQLRSLRSQAQHHGNQTHGQNTLCSYL